MLRDALSNEVAPFETGRATWREIRDDSASAHMSMNARTDARTWTVNQSVFAHDEDAVGIKRAD